MTVLPTEGRRRHPAAAVCTLETLVGWLGEGQTAFIYPTKITMIPLSGIQASVELFFPSLGLEPRR